MFARVSDISWSDKILVIILMNHYKFFIINLWNYIRYNDTYNITTNYVSYVIIYKE